jgi:hypothetical protein
MVAKSEKIEKHFGKIVTIAGDYEGDILINLNKPNNQTIEIYIMDDKQKGNGQTSSSKQSVKLDASLILSIQIDSSIYLVNNIEYAYNKTYKNCCMRLMYGTSKFGLYAWGTSNKSENTIVCSNIGPRFSIIKSTHFEDTKTFWMLLFSDCEELKETTRQKEKGFITPDMPVEKRVEIFKQLIDASAGCIK